MMAQHLANIGLVHHVDLLQTAGYPSKHKALTQCCPNVGPPSSTSAQH